MRNHSRFVLAGLFTASLMGNPIRLAADSKVDFNRDIRPLLARNCFACHGPDDGARESDLRLDTAAGATVDLGGYRAIEKGKPDDSRLIARIESSNPDKVMPPPDSGHRLTEDDKRRLREWIAAGAEYKVHWSFTPPKKAPLPAVAQADWPRHAIDHFVLSKLQASDLTPANHADRYRLIRRVSLDLTGLPPTPDEADAFVADAGDGAFERVVDRLLQSDAYGEHWARMWLDLARYADTKGYEKDRPREIWRYRDWVIDALNADMPFDRFSIEQLAGDLLPEPTVDQFLATAFHRNTMTNDEGGTDNEEFRIAAVKDRVDTTLQVWMGLTMGCGKCHSHKFDPISQHDYYSFLAFFNQTQDADRGDEAPVMATPTREQIAQIDSHDRSIKQVEKRLAEALQGVPEAFKKWRRDSVTGPVWQPLVLADFASGHGVMLSQRDDGTLIAAGDQPQQDSWTLICKLPESTGLTSLRLDSLPQAVAGGDWPDHNIVLSELTAEVVESGKPPRPVKLVNARADFSQTNWQVSKAIDGNASTGWAFSPKIAEPHAAVFDFEKPVPATAGTQLRLTIRQNYGQQHLLARFRVSVSTLAPKLLTADLDVDAGLRKAFERHEFPVTRTLYAQLDEQRRLLTAVRTAIPNTPVMRELAKGKQRETRIHRRGNFLDPGEPVEPGVPELFGRLPDDAPLDRLGVARWIMQPDNPLTARVMVNRVWSRLFGRGIVETEEDFGSQGLLPTHPELLDWLAVDFRENGWSVKQLLRTIVLSSTYRQSAVVTEEKLASDQQNRLFSRGPRFRLPAETVRDQALAVSGLLTRKIGGPSVMPPQPPGVWKSTYSALKWEDATGPNRYRRALYTYWKRTSPYPAMLTFDAGSGEVCQIRRVRTNTPLQALVTLNDPAYVEAAGALAGRMAAVDGSMAEKIRRGFRLTLIRPPSDREVGRLIGLYESIRASFTADPDAADHLVQAAGLKQGDAALVAVANVLLNLDETLMK